MFLTSESHMF